jgi:hypothetical protein
VNLNNILHFSTKGNETMKNQDFSTHGDPIQQGADPFHRNKKGLTESVKPFYYIPIGFAV